MKLEEKKVKQAERFPLRRASEKSGFQGISVVVAGVALFLVLSFFSALFLPNFVLAEKTGETSRTYSFENSERLKHLIEWRDYGSEAFSEALENNKPIFLLLTAPTWCYWCQVYESRDYLFNDQIYSYINRNFVPIYVDADKRQDLTRKYLEGGWPSTTVMTPSGERLFGFSGVRPVPVMLENLRRAVDYVSSLNATPGKARVPAYYERYRREYDNTTYGVPSESSLRQIINSYKYRILQTFDPVFGGFGTGRKFPQGRTLDYAVEQYSLNHDLRFLTVVVTTLRNQYTYLSDLDRNYNLFDPVEGGFHRYGTTRDWTPPHYEKMLYDNARLLRAYFHLLSLPLGTLDDETKSLASDVVFKTDAYIRKNWYDSANGGFYGNTDVHGEDKYYGKNPRPAEKPRVEKTKYSDWNGQAITTYLLMWNLSGNDTYREMAEKSLWFFSRRMLTEKGLYHYDRNGTRAVRGNIADNAYMLLAFVEGYEYLGRSDFLSSARKTVEYLLTNLYDWRNGAFIERNSPDRELYAPGEEIDLRKPSEENGILAYAILKLYRETGEKEYLLAGVRTLGYAVRKMRGLDRGYYTVKAAEFVLENNLLEVWASSKDELEKIESRRTSDFWMDNLFAGQKEKHLSVREGGFIPAREFQEADQAIILLLLASLLAGLLSFLSPCTLPIMPAYAAFALGSDKKSIFGLTLSFLSGLALVFSVLGMSAALAGRIVQNILEPFSRVAGLFIVAAGLYIIFGKGFSGLKIKRKKPAGYFGAFVFGGTMGFAWTPCTGPVLVSILLIASASQTVILGGLLLLAYAMGLGLPLVLLSKYVESLNRKSRIWKILRGKRLVFRFVGEKVVIHTTSLISGLLFVLLGILIFTGTLTSFNRYIGITSLQKKIFSFEEVLARWFR